MPKKEKYKPLQFVPVESYSWLSYSLCYTMENTNILSGVISGTDMYLNSQSEITAGILKLRLQDLINLSQANIFDPKNTEAARCFGRLYDLLSRLDTKSTVLWTVVKVLQSACQNSSAKIALIRSYRFVPILTDLLYTNVSKDEQICLLQLLQALTDTVEVSHKEAHLPRLLSKLSELIIHGDTDVVRVSISVLLNLCRHNISTVYSLKSCAGRQFFKAILSFKNDNIGTKVQICRLLFCLESVGASQELPEDPLLHILNNTLSNIAEVFEIRHIELLRELVDFFKEITCSSHFSTLLQTYDSFAENIEKLLHKLPGPGNLRALSLVFEFLYTLAEVQSPSVLNLYSEMTAVCIPQITSEPIVSLNVLRLLSVIVRNARKHTEVEEKITCMLNPCLPELLNFLNAKAATRDELFLTALIRLLKEMMKYEVWQSEIVFGVNKLEDIFQELSVHYERKGKATLSEEVTAFCVYGLSFVSELVKCDPLWTRVYTGLWSCQLFPKAVASALYTGEQCLREQALTFTGSGLSAECLSEVAEALTRYKSPPKNKTDNANLKENVCPPTTMALGGSVDEFISTFGNLLESNKTDNIPLSTVMTLVDYKLASASRQEQMLRMNLDIITDYNAKLQCEFDQINACIDKHHESLFQKQRVAEILREEKLELQTVLKKMNDENKQEQYTFAQEMRHLNLKIIRLQREIFDNEKLLSPVKEAKETLQSKVAAIEQQISDISEQRAKLNGRCEFVEEENKERDIKICKLTTIIDKMKKVLEDSDQNIIKKEAEVAKIKKESSSLETDLKNLEVIKRGNDKTLNDQEVEIIRLNQELSELLSMKNRIAEISAGRKENSHK